MVELTPSEFKVLLFLSASGKRRPIEISTDGKIPSGTVRPILRNLLKKELVSRGNAPLVGIPFYESNLPLYDVLMLLFNKNPKTKLPEKTRETKPNKKIKRTRLPVPDPANIEVASIIYDLHHKGYPDDEIRQILKSKGIKLPKKVRESNRKVN